jgi:hypothetical protein
MADVKSTSKRKEKIVKKVVAKKPTVKKTASKKKKEEIASSESDDPDDLSERDFTKLIEQVKSEYTQSSQFIKPKWDEWALRLKLYNNQKRDKEAVGDNTLFTIFQTVLASLYSDNLSASFIPREIGDEEVAENLDITAEYDHEAMEKDMLDYEWDFEAMFFGRSLCSFMEFDRDSNSMTPVPEIWNVMTVLRDPYATSVNGSGKKRKGAARFLGREVRMTRNEMDDIGEYFNYANLKTSKTSAQSLVDENMRITAEAAGLSDISKFSSLKGENDSYRLLEWFTIHNNKRVFVTLANDMTKVVRYRELEDIAIPIIDRTIYPIPNSWDGVSIPDLIEDKQRARAVLQNLGLKGAKANLHPMYLYNSTLIKNRSDLNFDFNKFISVSGNPSGAVAVMPKDNIKQDVQYILDTLNSGAERSTATPDFQQGVRPANGGTATRDALLNQKVDTRYSLSAKIFGWSEKRFWKQWYQLYKEYFADGIDEKSIRIAGALGAKWRPFTRENLIASTDPDVKIESRILAEEKQFNELQKFRSYMQYIAAAPNANLLFALRYMGKLSGLKKDIIGRLLPPTIEELRAEDENKLLSENKKVEVLPTDDNQTHIDIHNKMEDSPAKFAHMNAHKRAMTLRQARPDMFPTTQENSGVADEKVQNAKSERPMAASFIGRSLPA